MWFILRIVFVVAGFISCFVMITSGELRVPEFFANLFSLVYLGFMAYSLYSELTQWQQPRGLRKGVAVFTWFVALLVIGLAVFYTVRNVGMALVFGLLLIVFGVFDWIGFQKKESTPEV